MLRGLVIVLLLANALLWAWRQGWLGDAGLGAVPSGREPERLAQQVEPHRLRLLNPPGAAPAPPDVAAAPATAAPEAPANDTPSAPADAAAGPSAPPAEPRRCWQLSALPAAQAEALRRSADTDSALRGRVTEIAATLAPRWIVYLGKFPSAEALQRRRAELRQAGIDQREVNVAALSPGLALGTYSTEEAARKALQDVQRQGVRDARVVQERAETRLLTLRWPDLTAAEYSRLQAALGAAAKGLQACP
ncbi:MAG: SPOR domain-containing protein [Pseudomonadota bacterium]